MALTFTSRSCRRRWRPQAFPEAAASLVAWPSCCRVSSKAASSCSCTENRGQISDTTSNPRRQALQWKQLDSQDRGTLKDLRAKTLPSAPSPPVSCPDPPESVSGAGPAHTAWSTKSGGSGEGNVMDLSRRSPSQFHLGQWFSTLPKL